MDDEYSFDIIIAKSNGYMENSLSRFCTKGMVYKVINHYEDSFEIIDDADEIHYFDYSGEYGYKKWFDVV